MHPDEEDPRERSILPADMQGPPSPLLSEAQQSHPPANEEDEKRQTVTQQREMEAVGKQRDHDTIHWVVQMQPLLPLEGVGETSKTASNNHTPTELFIYCTYTRAC